MSAIRKAAKKNIKDIEKAAERLETDQSDVKDRIIAEADKKVREAEEKLALAEAQVEQAEKALRESQDIIAKGKIKKEEETGLHISIPRSIMDMLDEIAKYGTTKKKFVLQNITEPARVRYLEIQRSKKPHSGKEGK